MLQEISPIYFGFTIKQPSESDVFSSGNLKKKKKAWGLQGLNK